MIEACPSSHDKLPRFHARGCHGVAYTVLKWIIGSLIEFNRLFVAVLIVETLHPSHLFPSRFAAPHILANNHREKRTAREINRTSDGSFHHLRKQMLLGEGAFRVVYNLQQAANPGAGFLVGSEERGLVADLQNDIVIVIHFLSNFADVLGLPLNEVWVF